MKTILFLVAAATSLVGAQPHRHHHRHAAAVKRDPSAVEEAVAGPTVVVYELNGKIISQDDVEQGIQNGTLIWAGEGPIAAPSPSSSAVVVKTSSVSSVYSAPPSSTKAPEPSTSSAAPSTSATPSSTYVAPSSSKAAPSAAASSASASSDVSTASTGSDAIFPDGEIDCSTFPSKYGAVPVNWIGLGGWSGVQTPGDVSTAGFSKIFTATSGSKCTEGAYCSYACAPGYQKAHWPTTQGSTGQSVGGLLCKDGKLHLTNPTLSKSLCIKGSSKVQVKIQNKMGKNSAVCRTDYPGTEGETVPVDATPGNTVDLTCPDAANYYTWQGKGTSAQYYVNPKGYSVSDACQWGDGSKPIGNFAPVNLGVGYSSGNGWFSIFQNAPTTQEKLDFTIEITGDNVIGKCKYSNGQYCAGDNCNSQGCTVSASSGTVTYVFSES